MANEAPKVAPPAAELTTAQSIEMLVKALVANQPKGPLDMLGMSESKQKALTSPGEPQKYRIVPGKSPDTGSTFDMVVVQSKTHPEGRVTQLQNYKHPVGMYRSESNGGICPDGLRIWVAEEPSNLPEGVEPAKGSLTQEFLQLRWTEFYQKDLRNIIGDGKRQSGALKAHYCESPDGMKTPWLQGSSRSEES